jgi:molybdopterin-containing oxidoreductase family iron-sulfur binding subunit
MWKYDNISLNNGNLEAPPPRGVDRRDFLKIVGFSFGGALLAGCQPAKVEKAIPFLIQPEEVTPGVSTWYATTCAGCSAGCGVLAKNRDGRPIKLEGNPDHPISNGGLCPVGQASLLGLYDSQRLAAPLLAGKPSTWNEVDAAVLETLRRIRNDGGAVRILTGTVSSPTTKEYLHRFVSSFKNARHVQYDALSSSAILDAHAQTHGRRVLPRYRFEKADVIVSFDADFLGTWISPVEFTVGYRAKRSLNGNPPSFSYHAQIESRVTLTGSNADERFRRSPQELRRMIHQLAGVIAAKAALNIGISASADAAVNDLAERLWNARGASLVVSGLNDLTAQVQINFINHALGNYGVTVDIARPSFQKQGSDGELRSLIEELKSGTIAALIIHGCNPVYDLPDGAELGRLIQQVPLSVCITERLDETAEVSSVVCPEPHALESWNDAEPVAGVLTLAQPLLNPVGSTRPFVESLAAWIGERRSAYELIRQEWERTQFRRQSNERSFQNFWDRAVRDGAVEVEPERVAYSAFRFDAVRSVSRDAQSHFTDGDQLSLVLYPTVAMLDGRHAHNPWLQELPDPVTKIVWDNYVSVSRNTANAYGLAEGDVVRVESEKSMVELPVHIQPGQDDRTVAVALGYGRKGTDRFTAIGPQWLEAKPTVPPGELVGRNAAVFLEWDQHHLRYDGTGVRISKTGKHHVLASTQEHHSIHVPEHLARAGETRRPIIQQTTLEEYRANPAAGSFQKHEIVSLWGDPHSYPGHHWGMVIDLTACTGCSACVVSCIAENNIPVVGKDEVARNREMTWIRVDRYYDESDGGFSVAHQPMMCHHCDNAPCETVCPVLATVHSEEGLNQQVYNRCVGTRYCANNCPYKVRRFNWFQYKHGDERHKLVLNPDVTVRDRGVMEKCTFCVQRIQEAKIAAKKKGVALHDGDIQPACAQSCPAKAIVFGDTNDPNSEISKRIKDPRHYRVLEEIGVRPSVGYMTLVRNKDGHAAEGD